MVKKANFASGFSLVEILVALAVMGVVLAISLFGIQGSRLASRDSERKTELETVRSGLELYRADCGGYPAAAASPSNTVPNPLVGSGVGVCALANQYLSATPQDPVATQKYAYVPAPVGGPYTTYILCAHLENITGSPGVPSGCPTGPTGCAFSTDSPPASCNYKVTSP